MKFIILCKQCKNQMLYETKSQYLTGKRKTCVYCGKSLLVKENIGKRIE